MKGKVYIVGAGPGPADLLTLRAAEALRRAEVVLHDDLVTADVLELCPASAQIINVGKRCGRRGYSQEDINALMVAHAQQGRRVVRLKSGDPSVFGRLGEELDALREAQIPFAIVPGITAAAAAATAAEITLTDRRLASRLVFISGHSAHDDHRHFCTDDASRTTYAVYMPGPDYGRTARELVQAGVDADTPCALVSNAGRDNQQVRFMTVADLGAIRSVMPPAVLIVGKVAVRSEFMEILRLLKGNPEALSQSGNAILNQNATISSAQ